MYLIFLLAYIVERGQEVSFNYVLLSCMDHVPRTLVQLMELTNQAPRLNFKVVEAFNGTLLGSFITLGR